MHRYLTDEEISYIREEINKRRIPGAYMPGKWSVSHYNRRTEVLGKPYPKQVMLREISLRTLEQTPVVSVGREERLHLARALIEAGIRSLQVSWAGVGPGGTGWVDPDQVKKIRSFGPSVELTVEGILSPEHIDTAADMGLDVIQFTNLSIPAVTLISGAVGSATLAWEGKDWRSKTPPIKTVADQVKAALRLIGHAKKRKIKASASVNMLSYSTEEYLEQFCRAVNDAGADYITLYDGSGGMGPEAWGYVVSLVKRFAPNCKVAVHPHNTFGLGVSNALSAVHNGADVVELSVNHVCAASGQADLAEVAAALEILYGVDTGVKLEKLTGLRRLWEDVTGLKMALSKPVTGERAWMYTSDAAGKVDELLQCCVNPEILGNRRILGIGKGTGNRTIYDKLQELGVKIDKTLVPLVTQRVKEEISIRKRGLSDEEIKDVAVGVMAASSA